MADPVILQEWIGKAEDDFQFARISLIEKSPSTPTSVFSISKALKNT